MIASTRCGYGLPVLTLTPTTTPGIGAPTEPTTESSAFPRAVTDPATDLSFTRTTRGCPLSSNVTCVVGESLEKQKLDPFESRTGIGWRLNGGMGRLRAWAGVCGSKSSRTSRGAAVQMNGAVGVQLVLQHFPTRARDSDPT